MKKSNKLIKYVDVFTSYLHIQWRKVSIFYEIIGFVLYYLILFPIVNSCHENFSDVQNKIYK